MANFCKNGFAGGSDFKWKWDPNIENSLQYTHNAGCISSPDSGLKAAPTVFQSIMYNLISGLEGTVTYLDGILVVGRSEDELQSRIERLLKRVKEYDYDLKGEILKSTKYFAFVVNSERRYADPENIRAFVAIPPLTDVTKLRSFWDRSATTVVFYPLYMRYVGHCLLRKNTPADCQSTFEKSKSMLDSEMILTHYNPRFPITVANYDPNYGDGAVLRHIRGTLKLHFP